MVDGVDGGWCGVGGVGGVGGWYRETDSTSPLTASFDSHFQTDLVYLS